MPFDAPVTLTATAALSMIASASAYSDCGWKAVLMCTFACYGMANLFFGILYVHEQIKERAPQQRTIRAGLFVIAILALLFLFWRTGNVVADHFGCYR